LGVDGIPLTYPLTKVDYSTPWHLGIEGIFPVASDASSVKVPLTEDNFLDWGLDVISFSEVLFIYCNSSALNYLSTSWSNSSISPELSSTERELLFLFTSPVVSISI